MKWFLEEHNRNSKINGVIRMYRELGAWNISVDNCGQTSPYLHDMWKRAGIASALMLGLGAGGEVSTIHRAFPNISITAIEFDPEMIRITKEIGLYKPFPLPTIIEGDAHEQVVKLNEKFDIIMIDMFIGSKAVPFIAEDNFIEHIQRLLAPEGVVIVNVYKNVEYLEKIKSCFAYNEIWQYKQNMLGIFRTS
jgi:spermidine synthase